MNSVTKVARMLAPCFLIWIFSGCAGISERRAPYEPSQDKFADLVSAAERFDSRRTAALGASSEIPTFLDSGITLSNTACEIWFTGLARNERDTTLAKDFMNIVGNVLLGVAGINGANPSNLAKGALGLSAANTAFEVYRAEILLGSIEDIRAKIREDRKVAEEALLSRTDISFDAARRRLFEYHQLCSTGRIKVLLNTSLSGVKFEHPDLNLSSATDKAKATVLTANLKGLLGDVDVLLQDPDLLYQLYLVLVPFKAADATDPTVAKDARKNQVVAIYTAKFAALSGTDQNTVVTQLQQIAIALRFGERLKADTAADANQKLAEAQKALRVADSNVNTKLGSQDKNTQLMKSLSVDATTQKSGQEFAQAVRSANSPDQILAVSNDVELTRVLLEYQEAQRQLSLAAAGVNRAKAATSSLPSVTPRIVPIGQ